MTTSGSSPLTRGTHFDAVEKKVFDRFIPAYAGNSETLKMGAAALSVHPRLRGELPFASLSEIPSFGSSPLTRGTRLVEPDESGTYRFIPAYAGNSK